MDTDAFVAEGFVRLPHAFSRDVADAARAILWRDTGCAPDDPSTWTRPVIRLGMYAQPPFVAAANTPVLHAAFDALVGPRRWLPRDSLGTFPVRFPSPDDPGDAGWHVDASFDYERPDFLDWRANVRSKGRALLMLFLFSDVGDEDAPTRIRVGSHREMARRLAPAGDAGLSLRELAANGFAETADCREVLAHRGCRDGLPVPPLPGARRPAAPRNAAAVHGATAAAPGVALGTGRRARRGARGTGDPAGAGDGVVAYCSW